MKYEYQIAIPSSNRVEIIQQKTLAYLNSTNIDVKKIDIHVRQEDYDKYLQNLDPLTYGRLIAFDAPLGIKHARNHIASFYPNGTNLVCIDDDIEEIKEKTPKDRLERLSKLLELIEYGFDQSNLTGYRLWGIHYCNNAFYMVVNIRVSLTIIAGGFFGYTVQGKDEELVTIDNYGDVERTFNYYLADGGVIRLDQFTTKTKTRMHKGGTQSYKNWKSLVDPGGMQDYRNWQTCEDGARFLTKNYPTLCKYSVGKDGLPCVKVRDSKQIRRRSSL